MRVLPLPPSASTLPRVPIQSDPYQYSIKFAPQLAREKFNEPANRYLEVIPRPISTNLSCISGMMTAVTRRNYPAPGPISIMKIITSIYIPWIHSANTQRKYPITPLSLSLSPHCSTFWIPLKFKCPLGYWLIVTPRRRLVSFLPSLCLTFPLCAGWSEGCPWWPEIVGGTSPRPVGWISNWFILYPLFSPLFPLNFMTQFSHFVFQIR